MPGRGHEGHRVEVGVQLVGIAAYERWGERVTGLKAGQVLQATWQVE